MVFAPVQKIGLTLCTQNQSIGQKKERLKSLADLFRPPDQYFQISRKMQQWLCCGKVNAGGLRQGIDFKLRFRILQLPGQVMDVRAKNVAFIDRIKAVALRNKSLK
jgi:hypothetical protein